MAKRSASTTETISTSSFTQHPKVVEVVNKLKERFGNNFENLIVSDTLDKYGNQYVHLVQEGGGVLGVALVGYTYILEQCGIRFFRLAGTSAGAINTMMMAVIGCKEEPKSEKVLTYLCNKNLFDFVDGHPFAKRMIGNFITNKGYFDRVGRRIKALLKAILFFILLDFISIGLHKHFPQYAAVYITSFVITGLLLTVASMIAGYLFYLDTSFRKSGFGINPGNDFLNWMKTILHENNVDTIPELEKKAAELPAGLRLREGRTDPDPIKGLNADITLITSEIISQNKIELPKMWELFTLDDKQIHPAEFVRASMSIPVFFESYEINNIPNNDPRIIAAWQHHLHIDADCVPESARFVDGGILSNFPISLFYNPEVVVPRLPTFGIELDDEKPKPKDKPKMPKQMSLPAYLYRMFNTVRFYYDKDFLIKNELYKKGVGKIIVFDFNWLNFSISNEEKINLFVRGAQAAGEFLLGNDTKPGFNWDDYKNKRVAVYEKVTAKNPPVNSAANISNEKIKM
jgi:NTE family protein